MFHPLKQKTKTNPKEKNKKKRQSKWNCCNFSLLDRVIDDREGKEPGNYLVMAEFADEEEKSIANPTISENQI